MTFFFVAMLLGLLANLIHSFLRAQKQGMAQDNKLRLYQNIESTLLTELREAAQITSLNPQIVLTRPDNAAKQLFLDLDDCLDDGSFLSGGVYKPDTRMATVRYFLDGNRQLMREFQGSGPAFVSRVDGPVISMNLTRTANSPGTGALLELSLVAPVRDENETLYFSTYRSGR